MKQCAIALLVFSIFLISCKDNFPNFPDKDIILQQQLSFYPLKEGSYWIYETNKISADGVSTLQDGQDSVFVNGDTLIDGKNYTILQSDFNAPASQRYIREENFELVNEAGYVLFSSTNFSNFIHVDSNYGNGLLSLESVMQDEMVELQVPAGTFETFNVLNKWTTNTTATFANGDEERTTDNQYGRGIGKVRETYFYLGDASGAYYETVLKRHHIAE